MPSLDLRVNTRQKALRRRGNGGDEGIQRAMAIDGRVLEESADAGRIPLQRTGAVRHFAKATDAVRDGCIQATGWLASAARISPAANPERRLSPEPIAARVDRLQLDGELLLPPRLGKRPLLSGCRVWIRGAKPQPGGLQSNIVTSGEDLSEQASCITSFLF